MSNMPWFADCYVLVNSRSKKLVEEFLAHFLPLHRESAVEYEVPQFSDKPDHVIRTASDALSYLEEHPNEAHALYWANQGSGEVRAGMVFPTSDGHMIYGLSCPSENEQTADALLDAMKKFLNSDVAYITFETPPAGTAQEFVEIVKSLSNG